MKLLLMAEEKVTTSKATSTVGTLKGFLLGVRPLVALQVFQPGKRPATSCADMRSWLIRLGGRDVAIGGTVGIGLSGRVFL